MINKIAKKFTNISFYKCTSCNCFDDTMLDSYSFIEQTKGKYNIYDHYETMPANRRTQCSSIVAIDAEYCPRCGKKLMVNSTKKAKAKNHVWINGERK